MFAAHYVHDHYKLREQFHLHESFGVKIEDLKELYNIIGLKKSEGLSEEKVKKLDSLIDQLGLDKNRDRYFSVSRTNLDQS